ncbi:fused MFS/spermidine synthase [Roseovarius sp.]|uniref:fused MFS/spermidine synthase n=1 Tax=Roseovarius sp. TaxID=1486281 RepID=UPI0026331866|nr:fused MFS/spermidine synthase [Roseovarius sp.]MDM8168307.1 fused MFS/spermidine synthase [Roseovarius sp.]
MQVSDTPAAGVSTRVAPAIFIATMFLSASLLFFVQPLFARLVLPHVGGSPAVWTTAMLFFQTVLIAGYLYAHLLTRALPVRGQVLVHLGLWAAALLSLPLGVPEGWQLNPEGSTAWQTLLLFAAGVGLPFLALSANAPLIQFWYSRSGGPSAHDPYFLYGASNLGSLIALLAFPLAAEPIFGAGSIGLGWAAGFVALGGALALSAHFSHGPAAAAPTQRGTAADRPTASNYLLWGFLAFIPSSLMLSVTLKISIDMGSFPLVWVVPLALYLLSFVLAFSNRRLVSDRSLKIISALALAVLSLFVFGLHGNYLDWASVGILLLCFFCIALFAHRRLYAARPAGHNLTGFYLTMSVGGALGGLFNSILAPAIFPGLQEAVITALLAVLLFLPFGRNLRETVTSLSRGALIGFVVSVPALLTGLTPSGDGHWTAVLLILLIGGVLCLAWLRRSPLGAFAAGIVLLLVGTLFVPDHALWRDRSFFGTHVITEGDGLRIYGNGTTVHGAQRIADDTAARPEPLYYYHRNGPLGQVMSSARGRTAGTVGVVGLGVGSLACYSQPGQNWHFYEIDPLVDRIARSPEHFRFLSACTPEAPTHMGDGRMMLDRQRDLRFDILVIDAYSSDAVPVHLTTNEAMQLYLDRLSPGGLLLYHISNRYYDIDLPLARSAADLGLAARVQHYKGNARKDPGDSPSSVVMLARDPAAFGEMSADPRWRVLESDGGRVWTDDYANLISIMKR